MNNSAAKYGFYYGLTSIGVALVLWLVNKELLFKMSLQSILGLALAIIFMFLAIKAVKGEQEGFISFGEAIAASMLTYALGGLMAILFSFVLLNYIDPSLLEVQKEVAMETAENVIEMFGGTEESMEEMREEMEEEASSYSLGKNLMAWLFSLIFPGLIISLIMSAIMKKSNRSLNT